MTPLIINNLGYFFGFPPFGFLVPHAMILNVLMVITHFVTTNIIIIFVNFYGNNKTFKKFFLV